MEKTMRERRADLEHRLDRIVNVYETLDRFLDRLPEEIPDRVKNWAADRLKEDEELSELIEGIKNRRPPRLILIGRTGAGKSTLINAICGQYVAEISDVEVGTKRAHKYSYESFGKTIFEVIDTRGTGDDAAGHDEVARQQLFDALGEFNPDAVLFLQKADERGYRHQDVRTIHKIQEQSNRDLPVIAISSQVDKLEPSREKDPESYSRRKRDNIERAKAQLERDLRDDGIEPLAVLAVSSYMEWDRDPTTVDDPADRESLSIQFDGRYNVDELIDLLENNIDLEAGLTLMLAARLDRVSRRIADRFIRNFALIAGMVGTTPIPMSDIIVLTPLQITLIMLVAYLAGRDLSYSTARELLVSIGVAAPTGFGLRMVFQQGSKLANLIYPGAGSALSGTIAAGGTYGIGKASKAYFMQGAKREELHEIMEESAREFDADIPEPEDSATHGS